MKYLKYLLFFVLPFSFIDIVFATSINNDSYSQANLFQSSNKYDYSTNNLMGDDYSVVSTGSIGTSYSGKAYYLQFNFHHNLGIGKTYDLKVSSSTSDFTNQINGNRVVPLCYNTFSSSFNEDECDSINIVSVIRGATSSGQSKDFTIRFTTNSPLYQYWGFKIAGGMYNLTGVSNFKITNFDLKEVDTTGSENIIANAQSNAQSIIDSSNSNTQNIINNQNQNTNEIKDSINEVHDIFMGDCHASKNLLNLENYHSSSNGINVSVEDNVLNVVGTNNANYNITFDIPLKYEISSSNSLYKLFFSKTGTFSGIKTSLRNSSGSSVGLYSNNLENVTDSISANAYLFRIQIDSGVSVNSSFKAMVSASNSNTWEKPGLICENRLENQTNAINNVNDTMQDSSIDDKTGFFTGFSNNDHGLSSIITIPLSTIQTLTNSTCVSLSVPIPYTNRNITLPCMSDVYSQHIPTIYNLWQIVSFGIIAYFICIDIFHIVKGFKDPNSDKVEVLDL